MRINIFHVHTNSNIDKFHFTIKHLQYFLVTSEFERNSCPTVYTGKPIDFYIF